jgi:hypothetical protein
MNLIRLTCGRQVLALLLFLVPDLSAQERASEVTLRNNCRLAVQALVHGQPANKYDWALNVIDDCGTDGASAIAHELRDLRGSNERTPHLEVLVEAALLVRDVDLFRAAMEIAADEQAGEAARVHAISLLTLQVTRQILPYEALVSDPTKGDRLIFGPATSRGPDTLRELPPDACSAAQITLERIAESQARRVIRLAARQAFTAVQVEC